MASVEKVNIAQKLSLFSDHWSPKIVDELNGQHVKLITLLGEFVWHHHDEEEELFLVVDGRLKMELRDREVWIEEGEFVVVPRGVEHRPVAEEGGQRVAVRAGVDVEHRERESRDDRCRVRQDLRFGRWAF